MRSWKSGGGHLGRALCGALLVLGVAPMVRAEIYAWRTEDGSYAYTDDRDQIPARYRDQAKVLPRAPLSGYERFTRQDPVAASHYADRLERRLQSLRAANAAVAPAPAPAPPSGLTSVRVSTSGEIDLPLTPGEAPVVVDPGLAKRDGDFRTRRVTVVKQGDRTLAVIKSNQHNFDPVESIQDEDALDAGE